ncbi:MAG: HlyC/CorC family transporter [Clostridia bacterium]|nr:HlyC/CorC family transporter [Clostridia bacterium]
MPDGSTLTISLMLILVALSAFFSASETAYTSFNRAKMKTLATEGNKRAAAALKLSDNYDKLLSTILVGNNIVNISLSSIATIFFVQCLAETSLASAAAGISTAVITVVVLIFGEISPKSLAKEHAEGFAMAIAGVLRFLVIILTPINCIFMLWKKLLTKVFKAKAVDTVTEGEVLTLIDEAHEDGSIDEYNKELIENIFDFDDLSAGEIATHRTELTLLDISDDMDEWDNIINNSRFSRYPIYGDSVDDIIGILDARDYLRLEDKTRENVMATVVAPAYFVPEAVKADVLFKNMRDHKESLAVVLDEYGGLYGIVTMTDLVECLVGEFTQTDDDEEEVEMIEVLSEGSWRIAGSASISEVEEAIGIKFEDIDSDTFSGFVLGLYGSVPEDGTSFELSTDSLDIHIEEIKDHKIDRAVITVRPSESEEDKDEKEEKSKKDKAQESDSEK